MRLVAGWYWGSISVSQAREALLKKSEGTFLIRDSSHPRHMLALSVKTCCGPTSVRIEYRKGSFWLDSIAPMLPHLQSFPDVLSLIQHYMSPGQAPQGQASGHVHPENESDPAQHMAKDKGVPLRLTHPLHKPEVFPSLQHLTRLTINRHTSRPDQLPLPKPLLRYLLDYPFHIWGPPSLWFGMQRQRRCSGSHSINTHCVSGTVYHPRQQTWAQQESAVVLQYDKAQWHLTTDKLPLLTKLLLSSECPCSYIFLFQTLQACFVSSNM